jgi:hypothetical protein
LTHEKMDTETEDEYCARLWRELNEYTDKQMEQMAQQEWDEAYQEAKNRAEQSTGKQYKQAYAKTPYSKPVTGRKRTGDDYIIMLLTKGVIMNDQFRKTMNDCLTIYLYLKANIIRGRLLQDPLRVYRNYYEKGFLAASFTEKYLADAMGLSRYQVRKQLNKLHEAGIIKKDMIQTGKNKRHCVYVLGTHQFIGGVRKERFYIEDFIDESATKA